MTVLKTTTGQRDLPRYFTRAMKTLGQLRAGRLDFVLPDGRRFRVEGPLPGPAAEVRVIGADVFARLIREGDLGFCEAYLDGDWDTPDLQALMDLVQIPANSGVNDGFPGLALVRGYERLRHWLRGNSRRQARRNIAHHYDLGNEFYRLWLDETMTYSSALFRSGQESLEAAQQAKYAVLLEQLGAKPGDHLLEIGCGWGGFAEFAARRGMRVTGLTISQAQYDFARARIARAGLSDRVNLKLQDYRDETGHYDGIASIEMFEAVGEKYWPVYFETLRERLNPGARATLQIITVADSRFDAYRQTVDFIQRYIFPGGMLPSPSALRREVERAGLSLRGSLEFGDSYSRTLRRWYETFNARWPEISGMGFDERFHRMWNFYLTSCAGAFAGGNCDVTQITVTRPG